MKKLLGAALVVLAVAGCSAQPGSFREEVRPYTGQAADDAARDKMGVFVCQVMKQDNVHNASEGAAPLVRGGMSEADALSTVRVSVKWLCPDLASKV